MSKTTASVFKSWGPRDPGACWACVQSLQSLVGRKRLMALVQLQVEIRVSSSACLVQREAE